MFEYELEVTLDTGLGKVAVDVSGLNDCFLNIYQAFMFCQEINFKSQFASVHFFAASP